MSRETMEDLNRNFLVGFTEKRGRAWHYRADLQNEDQPNHFPGPIPLEVVRDRLFGWNPISEPVWTGKTKATVRRDESMQAIVRDDTGDRLGYFTTDYKIHHPRQWLLEEVSNILDDTLSIGGAGTPRRGRAAYVQVEVPDNVTTTEGVVFRPHLLAGTTLDGKQSTFYKLCSTIVVCDNTYAVAQSEKGNALKIKHTSQSLPRILDARKALGLVHKMADDFTAQIAELTSVKVDDRQWDRFVKEYVNDGKDKLGSGVQRTQTMALNKVEALTNLYTNDMRVAPWAGTAWGVMQAVNTYRHHLGIVRGMSRVERNAVNAMETAGEREDAKVRAMLSDILS